MRYLPFALIGLVTTATVELQAIQERSQTTTVAAGSDYDAGGLHRFLFGSKYRYLWTTPTRVEVLNLQTFGGGLTPTTAGGGRQTKSLRFRGRDGHEYGFRSVDKDPDVLPPEFEGTVVEDIVQDQISAAYPPGPAVATQLMEAVGILHTDPRLVVLPDDPALGEFRERFGGTLGFIEARAITGEGLIPFANAAEIIDGDEIFERVLRSPKDRVHTREFLKARLLDLLIGDWDRHRGQWGWARFGDDPVTHWVPIPEDRDQAFVRYDGLVPALGRLTIPQLVNFGENHSNTVGMHWNAQEVDRYFLTDLEKPVWDSVATDMQRRLTNPVIDRAAAAMPPEYRSLDSTRVANALKSRRDKLLGAATGLYRLLAQHVDIYATDASESATIATDRDGSVEVTIAERSTAGTVGAPYYRRRFNAGETAEIRVYLGGGNDRAVARGGGRRIVVRIVGGPGSDGFIDSSRVRGVHFYTSDGDAARGPGKARVHRGAYTRPPRVGNAPPVREWGQRWRVVGWGGFAPDVGLFIGGGAYRMGFGFRNHPYGSRVRFRAGYSTGASTGRAELLAQFYPSNSRVRAELDFRISGIEVVRFHGFGNEIGLSRPDDSDFYRVKQVQFRFDPSIVVPIAPRVEFGLGAAFKFSTTRETPGRFITDSLAGLYGTGEFGQLGGRARITVDTRNVSLHPTKGVLFEVAGSVFPKAWDVVSTFGEVHGHASTYLTAGPATLALRAGGKKVFGDAIPFQEAAFIGDARTVRLGRQNRFAGDAAVWGNAELRLRLGRIFLVLPGDFGIFGIADAGRVFYDPDPADADEMHYAFGGGVWISFLTTASTLSVAVTRGDEFTGVYVQAGFAY